MSSSVDHDHSRPAYLRPPARNETASHPARLLTGTGLKRAAGTATGNETMAARLSGGEGGRGVVGAESKGTAKSYSVVVLPKSNQTKIGKISANF